MSGLFVEQENFLSNIFSKYLLIGWPIRHSYLVIGISHCGIIIKKPQLLHRFSHIGFFWGQLSKNNDVKFYVCVHIISQFPTFYFPQRFYGEYCSCDFICYLSYQINCIIKFTIRRIISIVAIVVNFHKYL